MNAPEIVDYQTKIGVVYVGGCGLNTLRRTIDGHTPQDYPDYLLLGIDTDAKVQRKHFGKDQSPAQRERMNLWIDPGALFLHQLGTELRGAGGKPKVGKAAAMELNTLEVLIEFFNLVDEVFIVTSVGGGTGTGASPIVASLASMMGKPTMAIVVIPDPIERRTTRATEALAEIQSLVPTIAIRNAYMREIMAGYEPAERARLTHPEKLSLINDRSLVPMLIITREILQITGDINIDQADWETMLEHGNYVFFGLADLGEDKSKWEAFTAEEIVEELCAGEFQNAGIIPHGEVIGLWAHGLWPVIKTDRIIELVEERVIAGSKDKQPEVFFGLINEPGDDTMWIALLVVAKEVPVEVASVELTTYDVQTPVTLVAVDRQPTGDSRPQSVPGKSAQSHIRFRTEDGTWHEPLVSSDLASRFSTTYANIRATRSEVEELCREVETATGYLPVMPEKFLEVPERKRKGVVRLFGGARS